MTHAIALVRLAVLATLVAAGACGDSSPADPIDARPQGMIDARSRLEVDGTPIAPDAPTDLCAGI
ncbi:MAG TPA: hypothetical protein VFG83_06950, partial [Kofleriaceae bacterium]|nr:hypothetical protein [Kofleriaceae bacterium]